MFNKITIIGCGLIGSSLLRAIDKKKLSKEINIFDKSKEASIFIKNNFSAKVFNDISESVKESDLVIISSPLSSYKEILLSQIGHLIIFSPDETSNLAEHSGQRMVRLICGISCISPEDGRGKGCGGIGTDCSFN